MDKTHVNTMNRRGNYKSYAIF